MTSTPFTPATTNPTDSTPVPPTVAPPTVIHSSPAVEVIPDGAVTHLTVVPWYDPFLAQRGYDPRSAYVERFWLGILGPSATWLLRRLTRGLDEHPAGFRINMADTARALGLGQGTSRNSMVVRTVERLCQFGTAQLHAHDRLAVRRHVAPLNARQLQRLPLAVQHAHERWMSAPFDDETRRRAIVLAVGLLERGSDRWAVEQHLQGYGFPDRLAYEAMQHAYEITTQSPAEHPAPPAA